MSKQRSFIKQFLKDRKMVGSVRPSSKYLMEKMLQNIDFKNTKVIIELGPGNGVFTYEILKRMSQDSILLVFELNQRFVRNLKKNIKDKRAIFIYDSAEKMAAYLHANNLTTADVIVSSLPLYNFPQELRETIINNSFDVLKDSGKYIQFQYTKQAKKMLQSKFNSVSISFTPLNFPPAFIYTCEKKQ